MSKQLDLGAFLKDQADDGTMDGRGEFTVSHTQAARKLAKFALPRPSAWVCKLIQAANRWNCEAVQVRQTRTESLFHFSLPSLGQLPTEDAIVNALMSGKIGGKEPLDALATALRSMVEQAKLSFILVVDDGHITPRPVYAGAYYGEISEKARLDKRFNPKPGLSLTVYHRPPAQHDDTAADLVPRLRSYVPIINELDQYCHTSHVPILLDGRRVDSMINAPALGLHTNHRPLIFAGIKGLEHSPPHFRLPHDFEEKFLSLISHPRRVARKYYGEREFQAAFMVSARVASGLLDLLGPRRRSQLQWVNDGVIVEEEPFDYPTSTVGLTIFANAHELDTDLTGFTLLKNEEFHLRRHELLERVSAKVSERQSNAHLLFRLDEDEESPRDEEFDRQEEVRNRIKVLLRGSGAGIGLTLFNPVLGVPATLAAMVATYVRKPKPANQRILANSEELLATISKEMENLAVQIKGPEP